ncbi:MAG: hypothetical protein ACI30B_06340 [Paludibacteraceae bacterium]
MRKKKFLFAALFLAAFVFGFSACENPNGDLLNNGDDNTGITDNDSTTNNPNQGGDNNGGNTKPTTPEVPTLVATGGATDVAYSSVTLWGRINTDTLWAFPNVKWGIEYAMSKNNVIYHTTTKKICTTELQGMNADEYSVALAGLSGDTTVYYNAFLLINDVKYVYGEVDSVRLLSRLTVNSNNDDYGTVSGSDDYAFGEEVTITATAERGFVFKEWNDENTDNPRVVTVTSDMTYTATFVVVPNGSENGHEWVDLGLSVKWATCNVGATKPEETGNYFAWGETEPKTTYSWATYKWCNGSYDTLTKYNTSSSRGSVDNKTVLELADDAARANWGGAWRMPTDEEWTELRENCTWTWTSNYNGTGVAGRIVTSKTNGNHIFLPAAGFRSYDDLFYAGDDGFCWSSSINTDGPGGAWNVRFGSDGVDRGSNSRCYGLSVRPVLGE